MASACEIFVVAIDDSTAARRAIAAAIERARSGGALAFVNVVDTLAVTLPLAEGALIDPAPLMDALIDAGTALGREAVAQALAAGVSATSHVLEGSPAHMIGRFAFDVHARLIVIGTRAQTGLKRFLSGSLAETVVRASHIPVEVVHADDATHPGGPIAVAVDDSEFIHPAFRFALRAARRTRKRLELVHVAADATESSLAERLAHYREIADAAHVPCGIALGGGSTAAEIVRLADSLGCSEIIMATHARSALGRVLHPSIADHVVETARVPVTIVRARDELTATLPAYGPPMSL